MHTHTYTYIHCMDMHTSPPAVKSRPSSPPNHPDHPHRQAKGALAKPFVYLWVDHLGNRVYRATRNIGASPRSLQLWDPLKPDVRACIWSYCVGVRMCKVMMIGTASRPCPLPTPTTTSPTNPFFPLPTTVHQSEQDYPEAGISTPPTFTKYEQLGEDNLDDWVEHGFGEFDDVDERCVRACVREPGNQPARRGETVWEWVWV